MKSAVLSSHRKWLPQLNCLHSPEFLSRTLPYHHEVASIPLASCIPLPKASNTALVTQAIKAQIEIFGIKITFESIKSHLPQKVISKQSGCISQWDLSTIEKFSSLPSNESA